MKKSAEIVKNTIAFEDYKALSEAGINPGEVPLGELVLLLQKVKAGERSGYAEDLEFEEIIRTFENEERAKAVQSVYRRHRIPMKDYILQETKIAFEMLDSIENISDGLCEYLLKNGPEPTIENMVRLQYEKGSAAPITGVSRRNNIWSFPDKKLLDEEEMNRLIQDAGLEAGDFSKSQVAWLQEKGIYVSVRNLQLLNALWTLNLPLEDEETAHLLAEAIKDGRKPREGLLCSVGADAAGKDLQKAKPNNQPEGLQKNSQDALQKKDVDEGKKSQPEEEMLYHKMLKAYRWEYGKNHSADEYLKAEYKTFIKSIENAEDEMAVLISLGIPVTADYLAGMKILMSEEGETFFEKLAFFIGGRNLLQVFRRSAGQKFGESESYKKALRLLLEKVRGERIIKEALPLGRTLLLMAQLSKKGYEEIPVLLGRKWIRVRLKKDGENKFSALTANPVTGGIMIKYSEKENDVQVLVAGERADVLEEFEASNLLPERLKKAGKENARITYLVKEEFSFGEHFYPII
ncbi:MAG: hypothetical protein IKO32_01585 [Lachnospiraceae bacterium]|nr:hypothetical protein [Lachnospiraceae bacterium]